MLVQTKLYKMAYGFDIRAVIKATIEKILQLKQLLITLCTDSKSLYNCLIKLRITQEKQLMVDLMLSDNRYCRHIAVWWKMVESSGGTWWTDILPYSATLLLARLLLAPWRPTRYLYEHCPWSRNQASILLDRYINQSTHFINEQLYLHFVTVMSPVRRLKKLFSYYSIIWRNSTSSSDSDTSSS